MEKEKNVTYTKYSDYNRDRSRILGYAYSRIARQKSMVGLDQSAVGIVMQAIADRCESFWHKIPIQRGQKAYLNRMVQSCAFDFAKQYRQKVEVKCRNKAMLECVMADHDVAAYLKSVDTRAGSLTTRAIGKLFPSQERALAADERVLAVRRIETRFVRAMVDYEPEPCSVNAPLYDQLRADFAIAVRALAARSGPEGKVAVEFWLDGRPIHEIARDIKRSTRCCYQMLGRFACAMKETFPEFRSYLTDLDQESQRVTTVS